MAMSPLPTMSELQIRCTIMLGFGAMNSALKRIKPIVREHLMLAQDMLYENYRDELLRKINKDEPGKTVPGMVLYDVPDDCDPQEIKRFRAQNIEGTIETAGNGYWRNLVHGIDTPQRSYMTPSGPPRRYDVLLGTTDQAQFEIWPMPDAEWVLELEYWTRLARFTEDEDKCALNANLVFLYAITNLKNHYQQKDADSYAKQLEVRLKDIKGKQHGNKQYKRRFRNEQHDPWSDATHDEASNTSRVTLNDNW